MGVLTLTLALTPTRHYSNCLRGALTTFMRFRSGVLAHIPDLDGKGTIPIPKSKVGGSAIEGPMPALTLTIFFGSPNLGHVRIVKRVKSGYNFHHGLFCVICPPNTNPSPLSLSVLHHTSLGLILRHDAIRPGERMCVSVGGGGG